MIRPSIPGLPEHAIPVGSRVTCNPAPTDTDRDWLVLVDPKMLALFAQALELHGWTIGGSDIPDHELNTPEEERFVSFTLGQENIIATPSPEFHRRFLAATGIAKRFNLMIKDDRIALFQAVLYGNAGGPL